MPKNSIARIATHVGATATLLLLTALPLATLAQLPPPPGTLDISTCANLERVIGRIAQALGFIALLASVIVILIGAFAFLTGGGDPANVTKGRNYLIWGVVGLAVALIAFSLPRLVISILGATGTLSCP